MPESDNVADDQSRRESTRLGIGHFLLWMSTSAVLLVIYQYVEPIPSLPSDRQLFTSFIHIGYSMIHGAALASVFLLVMPIRRRGLFPVLPGHWLLLSMGVAYAPGLVLEVISANYLETNDDYLGNLTLQSRRI